MSTCLICRYSVTREDHERYRAYMNEYLAQTARSLVVTPPMPLDAFLEMEYRHEEHWGWASVLKKLQELKPHEIRTPVRFVIPKKETVLAPYVGQATSTADVLPYDTGMVSFRPINAWEWEYKIEGPVEISLFAPQDLIDTAPYDVYSTVRGRALVALAHEVAKEIHS